MVVVGGVKMNLFSDLVLREPKHGKRSVGGQAPTFVDLGGGHRGPQRLLAGGDG